MPKKCVKSNTFLMFPDIQHENHFCCHLATFASATLPGWILLMLKHNRIRRSSIA
jgi:hypothetical protein